MIDEPRRYGVEEVTDLLDQTAAPLIDLTAGSLCRIGGQDLLAAADRLEQVARLVFAAQVFLADELESQGVAGLLGSSSTGALLAERLLIPRAEANLRVKVAKQTLAQDSMSGGELEPVLPELGAAIAEGRINPDQVQSVVGAMTGLPAEVDAETRALAEHLMVEAAAVTPPVPFRNFCRQVVEQLDQDGDLPADKAHENVTLTIGQRSRRTGLTPFSGQLDDFGVQLLAKAIDGLSAPRPAADGTRDQRSAAVRRGQAFCEMLRRYLDLGDAPLDHGARPHVTVTLNHDDLIAAYEGAVATGATFDTGAPASPTILRRLLCDAGIVPVVLSGKGEVLDVGRERRTFTAAMRRAIVARDRGCTWPGCDKPPGWCDGHHVEWWELLQGKTSVDNGALLCAYHHTQIHLGHWKMRMTPAGPEFLPPKWIDPEQRWIRNTVHHLRPPRISPKPDDPEPEIAAPHRVNLRTALTGRLPAGAQARPEEI